MKSTRNTCKSYPRTKQKASEKTLKPEPKSETALKKKSNDTNSPHSANFSTSKNSSGKPQCSRNNSHLQKTTMMTFLTSLTPRQRSNIRSTSSSNNTKTRKIKTDCEFKDWKRKNKIYLSSAKSTKNKMKMTEEKSAISTKNSNSKNQNTKSISSNYKFFQKKCKNLKVSWLADQWYTMNQNLLFKNDRISITLKRQRMKSSLRRISL